MCVSIPMICTHGFHRHKEQIKQCPDYFDVTRKKQLQRRDAKDKEWQLLFLSTETWKKIRITCRGFFLYCRSLIDYSDNAPKGSIVKICVISPAHSNYSAIEAHFSTVRGANQDSATKYAAFIGSRDMFKANLALKNNKMYSAADVGVMTAGKEIGPSEFIKYHDGREKKMNGVIFSIIQTEYRMRTCQSQHSHRHFTPCFQRHSVDTRRMLCNS